MFSLDGARNKYMNAFYSLTLEKSSDFYFYKDRMNCLSILENQIERETFENILNFY